MRIRQDQMLQQLRGGAIASSGELADEGLKLAVPDSEIAANVPIPDEQTIEELALALRDARDPIAEMIRLFRHVNFDFDEKSSDA